MTGVKLDEALTCQLYATIPLGSVTDDHEIVKGSCTLAPAAGASGAGAGGGAAETRAARPQNIAAVTTERTQSFVFMGGCEAARRKPQKFRVKAHTGVTCACTSFGHACISYSDAIR